MIVTIDGPAGAGKSTLARMLAQRLSFRFLDTGAMYRAVTLAAMQRAADLADQQAVGDLARQLDIDVSSERVLLNGEDVSQAIRTSAVSAKIHYIADNAQVRSRLSELQRAVAAEGNIVTEGRDQGTMVFPAARCKIFLTASPEVRAKRRQEELAERGEAVDLDEVLLGIVDRDRRDQQRPVGALRRADDAVEVCTDGLSLDEVLSQLEAIVQTKR